MRLRPRPPPAGERRHARRPRPNLKAVKAEIERVTREVSASGGAGPAHPGPAQRGDVGGDGRGATLEVRRSAPKGPRRRSALAAEQHARESPARPRTAPALAAQLRAAYLIGRHEPLKLLLNQKDPAHAGRMFTYYGYFGRARAGQIKLIENEVQRIDELQVELAAEDEKLAAAGDSSSARARASWSGARQARARAGQPRGRSRTRARQNLERLRTQQADLERLLRELARAVRGVPVDRQRRLRPPARQARLAGRRAHGRALRRDTRRRSALGRRGDRHRSRRAGARRCARGA